MKNKKEETQQTSNAFLVRVTDIAGVPSAPCSCLLLPYFFLPKFKVTFFKFIDLSCTLCLIISIEITVTEILEP